MRKRSFAGLLAVTVTLLASGVVRADDSASSMATARALGTDGVMLADQGRCADAIPKLERAEKLYHAPTTAGRLGECYVETGKLVLGTEWLQRLVHEPAAPNRPAVFVAAVARAQQVLDKALPRIGALHVTVQAPANAKISLSVDGEPPSDNFIDVDRPTDPGSHNVQATAPGFFPASANVTLKEAETAKVSLKLEPDPNAPHDEPASDGKDPTRGPSSNSNDGSSVPPYIAFGVGVAGLGVGAVAGLMASSRASAAEDACPNKACVAGSKGERDLDAAKGMATVSTVGFIVGGIGVAAGVVLLFVRPSSAPSKASVGTERRSISVQPRVGLGYAGLQGSF